jgi:Skp family chaperone for outer membrane proteins
VGASTCQNDWNDLQQESLTAMKTALITTSIALLPAMLSLAPVAQAPASRVASPIAYVSAQRILEGSPDARTEFARIQTMQQQRTTALRAQQQALEATRQQLALAADAPARAQLQQQELKERTELERATAQAQADLQSLQREVNNTLQTKVRAVVEDLVKAQNIQLVLNGDSAVIWGASNIDLTPAVIERLNAKPAPAK